MKTLTKVKQRLCDVCNGGVPPAALARFPRLKMLDKAAWFLRCLLLGQWHRRPPEEDSSQPPVAGKPAPLQPCPGHHLAAAKAWPPGDGIYLFQKD